LNGFRKGEYYTRKEISQTLGGGVQDYLPHKDGAVVCACVTPEMNPHLPEVILVGQGEQIPRWARVFAGQKEHIPVFVKRSPSKWEYIGNYRVNSLSDDHAEIARHARFSGRDDIVLVLKLEKEGI
jgi:hypothetical protein